MPIRLMENFRALFYAPYYATHAQGFFKREGLDVELVSSDAPGDAVPKLMDGTIDITWGGPMRVMRARDQDAQTPLRVFRRSGVARSVLPDRDAAAAQPFQHSGTSTRSALRHGVRGADAVDVPATRPAPRGRHRSGKGSRATPTRTMDEELRCAARRRASLVQAFEPFISMAEQDKAGDILYAASTRGPTAYTAFIATREACATYRDEFAAMTRATGKMLTWLYATPAEELAKAVATFFPDIPG